MPPPAKKQCIRQCESTSPPILNLPDLNKEINSLMPSQIINEADHGNEITYYDGVPKAIRSKPVIERSQDLLTVPQRLSSEACSKIDKDVSEFIFFSSSLAFDLVENKRFIKIFKDGFPGYSLPTRRTLGGKLLNECYNRIKSEVHSVKLPSNTQYFYTLY